MKDRMGPRTEELTFARRRRCFPDTNSSPQDYFPPTVMVIYDILLDAPDRCGARGQISRIRSQKLPRRSLECSRSLAFLGFAFPRARRKSSFALFMLQSSLFLLGAIEVAEMRLRPDVEPDVGNLCGEIV